MRNALTVSILFLCFATGSGLLSQKPQDSVTIVGKSAYFNCSTSEPSKLIVWYHYAINEVHREAIYQYANFTEYWYPCYRKGRYVVERNPETGAFNLVIPMVILSDAGRYLCEVDGDEGMASLTVQVQVESSPMFVASEMCAPYIKPYSNAIICIVLIILPIAIGGIVFALWYLCVYRRKKRKPKETEELLQLSTTDDLPAKIKKLEAQLESERSEAKALKEQLQNLQKKNKASDSEITTQTNLDVTYLEDSPYPAGNFDYAEKRTLASTILTGASKEQRAPINGMTILGKELFVSHENTPVIEVYDSETFKFERNLAGISKSMDIASCKKANCLYIIFQEDSGSDSHIMKLDPKGQQNILTKKWPTRGERGRLSTYESNVIVCLFEKQTIHEFSGEGTLINTVYLSLAFGFKHPWHAIKVASDHFVVCHGDVKDELHRVCKVNVKGDILLELKEWESKIRNEKRGKLNVPICLVGVNEGSIILVADRNSQKIRLLDDSFHHQCNIVGKEMLLDGNPVRICLDEKVGQLFVAANRPKKIRGGWTDGRIVIFDVKQLIKT